MTSQEHLPYPQVHPPTFGIGDHVGGGDQAIWEAAFDEIEAQMEVILLAKEMEDFSFYRHPPFSHLRGGKDYQKDLNSCGRSMGWNDMRRLWLDLGRKWVRSSVWRVGVLESQKKNRCQG